MKLSKKFIIYLSLIMILSSIFLCGQSFATGTEPPELYSPAVILIDASTGKILFEKNMHERRYPASLTKVMTAIIVLENCKLNEVATVSKNAVTTIPSGYVTALLQEGEQFTVEQLLYLLLIPSANDAAIVLAEHVVGGTDNIDQFFVLMNNKAVELGCKDTHFVNPNGIHDESHYSTAYDLSLMAKAAMDNVVFRNIVATVKYELPATSLYNSNDRIFTNNNSLLRLNNNDSPDNYYYQYATGVKTGFTTPAGNCLIASATKNKLSLITVTLGSLQTDDGLSQRYLDTLSLFRYGYDTYAIKEVAKKGQIVQTINISGATHDTKRLDIAISSNVSVLIKKEDSKDTLLPKIVLDEKMKAPIKKDDIVGTITYDVEGITYTYDLIANSDVKPSVALRNFLIIIAVLLLLGYIRYRVVFGKKNIRLKKQIKKNYKKR